MNDTTIHTFAKWQVKPGQLDRVLELLQTVVSKSTQEEGNLFYTVHQNSSDANMILLFEGYKDQVALTEHRQSEYFQETIITQIIPLLENREVILARPLLFNEA